MINDGRSTMTNEPENLETVNLFELVNIFLIPIFLIKTHFLKKSMINDGLVNHDRRTGKLPATRLYGRP